MKKKTKKIRAWGVINEMGKRIATERETKRDMFAAAYLQGAASNLPVWDVASNSGISKATDESMLKRVAEIAYLYADAMLATRSKGEK